MGRGRVIDPMKTRRLEGRFGLTGVTPSFIQPFLSKGEKAEGVVNADLRAGGTLINRNYTAVQRLRTLW